MLQRLTLSRCRTLPSLGQSLCGCLSADLGFASAYLLLLLVEQLDLALELLLLWIDKFVNAHGMLLSVEVACFDARIYLLWSSGVVIKGAWGSRMVDVCRQMES